MFEYCIQVNGDYSVCFFSVENKMYKIIYQKRRWISIKNKILRCVKRIWKLFNPELIIM